VSTKHAKLFRPDTDVEIGIDASVMVAHAQSSSEFSWAPYTFRGWRMKLHVFSNEMVKTITDHRATVQRTSVAVEALRPFEDDADRLRTSTEPKAIAVVKRYDELHAAATKRHEAAMQIPFAQYKDALRVEKTPCTL
jgi:hypothetical protein